MNREKQQAQEKARALHKEFGTRKSALGVVEHIIKALDQSKAIDEIRDFYIRVRRVIGMQDY